MCSRKARLARYFSDRIVHIKVGLTGSLRLLLSSGVFPESKESKTAKFTTLHRQIERHQDGSRWDEKPMTTISVAAKVLAQFFGRLLKGIILGRSR